MKYIERKKKKGKNAFHDAFHVPIFFVCFPGKRGIPKIKDLKMC